MNTVEERIKHCIDTLVADGDAPPFEVTINTNQYDQMNTEHVIVLGVRSIVLDDNVPDDMMVVRGSKS